jgi:MFS-type transporter involved in bile tolerance (Atg22 family)
VAIKKKISIFFLTLISNYDILGRLWFKVKIKLRGDQEGLFKLVTLDPILNRITGVTSGCWWLVVVNAIPISDICKINQQNISSCSVINNRIKKFS